ncbi:di-heme oxidoreductase family protein [Leptothoe sp. PORK10 BA2]|uniref:di-heme oxidoreductase family protein n=1 Tax=Leptothoe sp. PORK10 BA2 TaxID=3110254 RepID=UPI002B1FE436|nr:di-heme oxidoredictase family protein [Leptothoe sp. PORK10 BA2]MEA5464570.1 di-heme oxidoredictase family protein [Leptothoe sp. PORK10 BA2]
MVTSSVFPLRSFRWLTYGLLFGVAIAISILLSQALTPSIPKAGGITTLYDRSSHSFGLPAPGLTPDEMDIHREGDVAFDAVFVTAPSLVNPGLGPVFNNNSCGACHIKNGRGMPELGQSLVRVSLPGEPQSPEQEGIPVPNIGHQIRDRSVYGVPADAKVALTWQTQPGQYPDGTAYELRFPQINLSQRDPHKPMPDNVLTSLRMPPAVFGAGLLEEIPEQTLRKLSDPDDSNGDGISGRINQVWDPEANAIAVGRFGLKANSPHLRHQTAAAYVNDMGITNPVFPGSNGEQDIGEQILQENTFYVQSLGVPARTLLDHPDVQAGEKLFAAANCTACHVSTLKTGPSAIAALSNQTFHPYTELLLHDMGEGLADHRPDFAADGQEWRTSPLWGLGLVQTVLPYAGYLHDGRARSVEEAILWHGGEAKAAQQSFMVMDQQQRQQLLAFLNSL